MKEQDLIHTIEEQSQNIEVPENLSPENMKKMLDEHMELTKTFKAEADDTPPSANRNRYIRQTPSMFS